MIRLIVDLQLGKKMTGRSAVKIMYGLWIVGQYSSNPIDRTMVGVDLSRSRVETREYIDRYIGYDTIPIRVRLSSLVGERVRSIVVG